jgi:hypothetical protein
MEYEKKFLVIGNKNAITYKEVFGYIKNNKLWLGITGPNEFTLLDGTTTKKVNGLCRWFTNLTHKKRTEDIILYKKYKKKDYPKYDNYDAIEVSKVKDIPMDYDGIMGVPVTFLDKYNPEQFEVIWQATGNTRVSASDKVLEELGYKQNKEDRGGCPVLKGKRTYSRILIKRKKYNEKDYPKYDNYDAIEVGKVKDIPEDYDGVMGVPITFLNHYNPEQFEILGMCENIDLYGLKTKVYSSAECKQAYYDKFGKEGTYDLNASGVVSRNGLLEKVYERILIIKRRKK